MQQRDDKACHLSNFRAANALSSPLLSFSLLPGTSQLPCPALPLPCSCPCPCPCPCLCPCQDSSSVNMCSLLCRIALVQKLLKQNRSGTAGLIAGCPTTVVPFFGDQPFWGAACCRMGVGPKPIPIDKLDTPSLVEALRFMMKPEVQEAARTTGKGIEQVCEQMYHNDPLHQPSRQTSFRLTKICFSKIYLSEVLKDRKH